MLYALLARRASMTLREALRQRPRILYSIPLGVIVEVDIDRIQAFSQFRNPSRPVVKLLIGIATIVESA